MNQPPHHPLTDAMISLCFNLFLEGVASYKIFKPMVSILSCDLITEKSFDQILKFLDRYICFQIFFDHSLSRYMQTFEMYFFKSYSFRYMKKKIDVHKNCCNSLNTNQIDILSVAACPPRFFQ